VTTSSTPAAARRVRESCRASAVPLQEPRDALVERALVLRKARERRGGQNAVPAPGALAHAVLPRPVDGDLAFLAEAPLPLRRERREQIALAVVGEERLQVGRRHLAGVGRRERRDRLLERVADRPERLEPLGRGVDAGGERDLRVLLGAV